MDPETLRMVERILIAVGGGLSIYLGYRLFLAVPTAKAADGTFEIPGVGTVVLSRVGPGIFFALFGAAILMLGVFRSVEVVKTPSNLMAQFRGLQSPALNLENYVEAQRSVRFIRSQLSKLPAEQREEFAGHIERVEKYIVGPAGGFRMLGQSEPGEGLPNTVREKLQFQGSPS